MKEFSSAEVIAAKPPLMPSWFKVVERYSELAVPQSVFACVTA